MATITVHTIDNLLAKHGTRFFDKDLNPIEPQKGMWFAEFEAEFFQPDDEEVLAGELVCYVGDGRVMGENDDDERRPYGMLVKQG